MPILYSNVLKDLVETDTLKILKKSQKVSGNSNYYFTPNLSLELYNPKVMFVTPKFIVLEFDRVKHASLLTLIKGINSTLLYQLRKRYSELYSKNIYDIVSEKESTFTIRCFLPNSSGKYFINCTNNQNETLTYKLPRVSSQYDIATVEIRNVWVNGEKSGFNIELKNVHYIN
jgi:hypothetical protein